MNTLRIIITGAPGTGKSSLLDLLAKQYPTVEEAARIIIKQELAARSHDLPWDDLMAFSKKVIALQHQQYEDFQGKIAFYDRGMPDVFAYLRSQKLTPTEEMRKLVHDNPYHTKVFITPPWENIYANDNERKESFEEAATIHDHLVNIYQELSYELVEIPKLSIEKRLAFVLDNYQ